MHIGDYLAIFGLAVSAVIFLWLAKESRAKHLSVESYLLDDRKARKADFGPSMVAASTSLATVIMFFIAFSEHFGLVLLFCGATYLAGQAFFINFLAKAKIDTHDLTTNADFWRKFSLAEGSARLIALLTFSTFLVILFIELYIGSVIIQYYFKDLGKIGKSLSFFALGAIVISYVRVGGLRVVFRTDAWQLRLMVASMIALSIFALSAPATGESSFSISQLFYVRASGYDILFFCAWIALINFTLPFTQLSSWQRIAATTTVQEAWSGLIKQIGPFLVVWCVPVIAFVILGAKGYALTDLPSLFDALRSSSSVVEGILFPVIFVGFSSALFSTADSAMIALQFAATDKGLSGNHFKGVKESEFRKKLLIVMFLIVALLSVIFSLAEANLGPWFLPLIFGMFGQLAVFSPQLIYALRSTIKGRTSLPLSRLGEMANFYAIILGWIVIISSALLKAQEVLPQQGTQEIATFVAVIISGLGVLVGHIHSRNKLNSIVEK